MPLRDMKTGFWRDSPSGVFRMDWAEASGICSEAEPDRCRASCRIRLIRKPVTVWNLRRAGKHISRRHGPRLHCVFIRCRDQAQEKYFPSAPRRRPFPVSAPASVFHIGTAWGALFSHHCGRSRNSSCKRDRTETNACDPVFGRFPAYRYKTLSYNICHMLFLPWRPPG